MVAQAKSKRKKNAKEKKEKPSSQSVDYVSWNLNWSPRKGNFCSWKFMFDRRSLGTPYLCAILHVWRVGYGPDGVRHYSSYRIRSSINYQIIFVYMNLRPLCVWEVGYCNAALRHIVLFVCHVLIGQWTLDVDTQVHIGCAIDGNAFYFSVSNRREFYFSNFPINELHSLMSLRMHCMHIKNAISFQILDKRRILNVLFNDHFGWHFYALHWIIWRSSYYPIHHILIAKLTKTKHISLASSHLQFYSSPSIL